MSGTCGGRAGSAAALAVRGGESSRLQRLCCVSSAWPHWLGGGARARRQWPPARGAAMTAYFTAGAANFATKIWRAPSVVHRLTRREVPGNFMRALVHTSSKLVLLTNSPTRVLPDEKAPKPRTSRRARRRAVPGTPRNPNSAPCGSRQPNRFEERAKRARAVADRLPGAHQKGAVDGARPRAAQARPRSPPHPSKSRWPRGPRWCP